MRPLRLPRPPVLAAAQADNKETRNAFALFLFATALTVSAQTCDRAWLKTTLDQYLNAVTKHDPSAAPLFLGFRQTENAAVVKLGMGMWESRDVDFTPVEERESVDAIVALNHSRYQTVRDPEILTRISRYEMAFKMQTSKRFLMRLPAAGSNGASHTEQPTNSDTPRKSILSAFMT